MPIDIEAAMQGMAAIYAVEKRILRRFRKIGTPAIAMALHQQIFWQFGTPDWADPFFQALGQRILIALTPYGVGINNGDAPMTKTVHNFYNEAIALRNRIVSRQSNERPIMAWAAVCRACAKAHDAYRREFYRREFDARSGGRGYTRLELNTMNNLDRVWWCAKAQVETLGRAAH